ncbi:uncharacterized protein [Amphiura filiformis]|uniref:uncharacterized protein isoform X2 n=1 Tax=Amphiura filiformis TaxID=82378 RepID=UPI003B21D63E
MKLLNGAVIFAFTTFLMKGCVTQTVCPDGLYGIGCSEACTCVSAPSDTVCDSDDGTCSCQPAFDGAACDKRDFTVSVSSLNKNVYEGHTLTLVCRTNIPVQDVSNYRVQFTLPSLVTTYGNLHVDDSMDVGKYRVSLTGISMEQYSGTYRCTVGTTIPGEGLVTRYNETVINVIVPVPPSVIESVKSTSSSTLFAEWIILSNSGNSASTTCTVQYKLSSEPQDWIIAANDIPIDIQTRYLIGDLSAYTDYDVRLTCENEIGSSNVVELIAIKTGVSYPESPFGVSTDSIAQTSAEIKWYEPFVRNGPISFYRVTLQSSKTPLTVYSTEDGSHPYITIDSLVPDTTYDVEIYAVNVDITGQYAGPGSNEEFSFTTLPYPPSSPTAVSAEDDEQYCIIQWEEPLSPNGILSHYTVYYTVRGLTETDDVYGAIDGEGSIEVDAFTFEYRFTKETLKSYSRYDFKLTATTDNGEGEQCICDSVYCTTQPGAPEEDVITAPEKAAQSSQSASRVTKTTIPMTLNKVSSRSGPITCYEVVVIPLDKLQDLSGTKPNEDFPPENITDYATSGAQPGHPYVALTFSSEEMTANTSTVVIGDGSLTECSDSPLTNGTRRRRRETEVARKRNAENGPLRSGVLYSAFVRVYALVDDNMVEYASSSYMEPVRTKDNRGPVLQGTIAATIAVVLLMGTMGALILVCFNLGNRTPTSDKIITGKEEEAEAEFDAIYVNTQVTPNGNHNILNENQAPELVTTYDVENQPIEDTDVDHVDNTQTQVYYSDNNVDDLPAYMADEESDQDGGGSYVNIPRITDDETLQTEMEEQTSDTESGMENQLQ